MKDTNKKRNESGNRIAAQKDIFGISQNLGLLIFIFYLGKILIQIAFYLKFSFLIY